MAVSGCLLNAKMHIFRRFLRWPPLPNLYELSDQITVSAKYDSAHLLINWLAFGTKKGLRWKNHPAEEWVCIAVVPNAPTSSLAHALALSARTFVCLLVLLIFDWLPHCCSFLELGPLTQTDLSAWLWSHINMTNKQIESETLQGLLRIPSNGTS